MHEELKWWTVSETLAGILKDLFRISELKYFRLVGGTSLSLQLGHRKSVDIDLFTDQEFGSIDLREIDAALRRIFAYVSDDHNGVYSPGIMRMVGYSESDFIKLDLFYTDSFVCDHIEADGIRMAAVDDIAAMKLEVIAVDGRKRDFWDMHELLEIYEIADLLNLFAKRNSYMSEDLVVNGLTNFRRADQEEDPVCLRGKYWELIKIDLEQKVSEYLKSVG